MIKFGKVVLRPVERTDLELVQKWYNDDEVMYWASGAKPDMMVSMDYLEDVWFDGTFTDYSLKLVIETEDGEPIGLVGFRDMDISARKCRISLFIGQKQYWSKGYGSDALKGFLSYLFRRCNLNRVEADTWKGNERAISTYEKCGFKVEGTLRQGKFVDGSYKDEIILGILKNEYIQTTKEEKHETKCD